MAENPKADDSITDEEMGLPDDCDESSPLLSDSLQDVVRHISDRGGEDVVQFSAPMFFVDEDEGYLKVEIIRLGTIKGVVAVRYSTEDGSGKASTHYEHAEDHVVFEDGEHTKSISIRILEDGLWSATNEFKLCLSQPSNCQLGLYISRCRVKILNHEKFPTDKYREEIIKSQEAIEEIDDWGLSCEYWKLNYNSAGQRWQTIFVLVGDQLGSICLFCTLCVGVYMVDTIFARGKSSANRLILQDRYHTACVIALWYVVPHIVLYFWETLKIYMDIRGSSRAFLQDVLMRTSLAYTAESREKVSASELNVAMNSSADQVAQGYVAALTSVGILGRVAAIVIFINFYQAEPLATWSVLILVIIVVTFTIVRVGVSHRAQVRLEEKVMLVETLTDESRQKYRLFADYAKRGFITDMFVQAVDEYNMESIPNSLIFLNTQYAMKFLLGFSIAVYIVARTPAVLDNSLSLGVFLATITIFCTYLSDAINDLNTQMILIVNSFVPLKEYVLFLNLPLELSDLKNINQARREHTTSDRLNILPSSAKLPSSMSMGRTLSVHDEIAFKSHRIPITIADLSFEYTPGISILKDVNLSIKQGQLIALVGPHGSGKTTFSELFSNILVPTAGNIFVPSHLRVLHVDREPMFLRASLWHNLTLGLGQVSKSERERMNAILKLLDMDHIIAVIDEELEETGGLTESARHNETVKLDHQELRFLENAHTSWEQIMTLSQRIKLHLARALIANPEVLIIKRTLQGFNDEVAELMLDILRKHVSERGVCLPEAGRSSRRPRNVMFITENISEAIQADTVLQMDADNKTILQTTPQDFANQAAPRRRGSLDSSFSDVLLPR